MNKLLRVIYRIPADACKAHTQQELVELLREKRCIVAVYPNGDELIVEYSAGSYHKLGELSYIHVFYAERHDGSRTDDDSSEFHFTVCHTEYFGTNEPELAIIAFNNRLNGECANCTGYGSSLEQIKEKENVCGK